MKNQYFGDINDYRKYGLLRVLREQLDGRFLVSWMLTPNDGSGDGRIRAYLDTPERWRHYDPGLYDGLRSLVGRGAVPDVTLMERSNLISDTMYYSKIVPDKRSPRDTWRQGMFDAAQGADLVFVDPDNGLEVPSKPIGRKGSSKYVTWNEVERLWGAGSSILIYQHFRREKRDAFTSRMVSELALLTRARYTAAFRTPNVLFLMAVQQRHEGAARRVAKFLQGAWDGQIMSVGLANKTMQPTSVAGRVAVIGESVRAACS